jgi:hypothetical protein
LSEDARQKLALSIGAANTADVPEQMFGAVQYHLSSYPGAIQAVDNAPRASDCVTEFRILGQHADALTKALRSANPRIMETLQADLETDHAITLDAVQAAITSLSASTSHMIEVFAAEADRGGRPKLQALGMLIDSLRKLFKTHYRGTNGGRRRRGAVQQLTDRQNNELQFLRVALADAGIKVGEPKLRKMLIAHRQEKKPPRQKR